MKTQYRLALVRSLLAQDPALPAPEIVQRLKARGIRIKPRSAQWLRYRVRKDLGLVGPNRHPLTARVRIPGKRGAPSYAPILSQSLGFTFHGGLL